ncbi:MAG: LytTR family transcriptional regulator [Puniceicoccales bacterium]|nr:LytTR family transcriptional regulator [Puniceicoccales bacterium]
MLPVHGDRCIGGLVGYAQKETRNWNEMEIEMLRCSAKILGRILMQGNTPHFFLERAKYTKALQGNDTESLPFQDILRIQSDRNYTKVVMSDGKIYTELRSLAEWLKILPPGIFARVHRSHLINIAHAVRVVKIGSMCKIEFEGEGIDIPVGRAYRANLKKLTLRS